MTAPAAEAVETRNPDLCDLCDRRYRYGPDDRHLCYRHYVEAYLPITFVFHRGIPAFAREVLESEELNNRLAGQWGARMPHVTVHLFSRKESESPAWKRNWEMSPSHPERPFDKSWAYRGWCSHYKGTIVILVDDVGVETYDSIAWIFWHELGHMAVSEIDLVDDTFHREDSKSTLDQSGFDDDQKHEALAEELFVNRIATSIVGQDLNRLWFRARVNTYLSTLNQPPSIVQADGGAL